MVKDALRYVRRNAVAFLALFVALGGTATATHLAVDGSDVIDESLTGADIEGSSAAGVEGTIRGEDLKDGTINAKNLAIGAVNGQRVADESLTTSDIENRSLSWGDLELGTRNGYFVRNFPISTTMLVDQRFGTTGIGENEIAGALHRRRSDGSKNEGFVRVHCTESGFSVTYESTENAPPGPQRVWTDNGSSVRYRTLLSGASLTAVSSDAAVPEGRHVEIRVHSINQDLDAAFDVMVARVQQGRGDPCLWHATNIGSHEVDLD